MVRARRSAHRPGRAHGNASTPEAPAPELEAEHDHALSAAQRERLARLLLAWYDEAQRALPWRSTRDPYAIWVSEVMLQQTQVATVLGYYARWLDRFPDVTALARASEDDVLHAWQGLGYYSRARRLAEGARYLVREHAGRLPETTEAWLEVPGVGRYTAGAVTSIAFNKMAAVLDGNVMRVLCRLLALPGNPQRAPLNEALWRHAESLLLPDRPGDVNQALMELGATVCTPRTPSCDACPWRAECRARAAGAADRYPELPRRPAPTEVTMAAAIVEHRGRVLLGQAEATATRWASMWMFPCAEAKTEPLARRALGQLLRERTGLSVELGEKLGAFKHSVTRFRITLHAHFATLGRAGRLPNGFVWCPPSALADYALPAVHRRIASRLAFKAD